MGRQLDCGKHIAVEMTTLRYAIYENGRPVTVRDALTNEIYVPTHEKCTNDASYHKLEHSNSTYVCGIHECKHKNSPLLHTLLVIFP